MPTLNPSRLFAFLVEFGNAATDLRPGGDIIALAAEKTKAALKWKGTDDNFTGGSLFEKLEPFQRDPLMKVVDFLTESDEMGKVGTFVLALDQRCQLYNAVYAYQSLPSGELVTLPRPDCAVDDIVAVSLPVLGFAYETFSTGESRIVAVILNEESGELRPCDEEVAFVGVARYNNATRETAIEMARAWWQEQLNSRHGRETP